MVFSYFSSQPLPTRLLVLCTTYLVSGAMTVAQAKEIEFNTDILDLQERQNIDLGQFSRSGYIMPGLYTMNLRVNKNEFSDITVEFLNPEGDPTISEACLTPDIVKLFGLTESANSKLIWTHDNKCLSMESFPGMFAAGDLGNSTLSVNIPQIYLEYSAPNWDPPSRWDHGIPGLLADYNLNLQSHRQSGVNGYSISGNGTVGANAGAWRLRADWQTRVEHNAGPDTPGERRWDWSRYYAYRPIPRLKAKLTLGEDSLQSDIFDSFRFIGMSLITDDNMLPPNLRGYAPEITGVAKTNAKVIISQQGRILSETMVAAGPFRIQDINDAITGQLDIKIEEQDGSVQEFSIDTASIPYLTRPGMVRYKIALGRPNDWQHKVNGPTFGTGEFSWGVSNGWSVYGGGVASQDYNSLALGIGRDLMFLGAISFDATQSRTKTNYSDEVLTGGSYRLSYSKRFDDYDSQITFAGYRFSERNFMSMGEYLEMNQTNTRTHNSKERYTISFHKHFRDLGLSTYLNYNHHTYWDRPDNDRYTFTASKTFDAGSFKNLNLSLTAFRNKFNDTNDDGMYMSLSIPWGNGSSLSYNNTISSNYNSHQVSWYDRIDEYDNYRLTTGVADSGVMGSGYYSHQGDVAQVTANASYQEGRYSSYGLMLQGGMTATAEGAALHRTGTTGGTRILVDTDDVSDIPIRGYGSTVSTNIFGKAVITDVSSYYRNNLNINLDALPDNAEAVRSTVQATLTEGAIGYRRFNVISGEKAMAVIRLPSGDFPPFGSSVFNKKKQEVGIVNDRGYVYLSGIKPGEQMRIHWGGKAQCELSLPEGLFIKGQPELLLPCHLIEVDEKENNPV